MYQQQPSRISRYEIKTLIAAGGMGALYLARDTNPNTNRLVALKLLNATLDSHEMRERFAREARALAALDHPNIVNIYDSGEFQGSPFIVMEYVRGETFAEKIKRKAPLTVAQKLKLMVELCSGLAHAHDAGIIHRDIKPANLMVDQYGRLKILDFGIARVSEGTRIGVQMTQLDVRIGTPGYMSPEQIEGGELDRRSDIFAAGTVCYELLAFREAFTGANTRQIENKVLESQPPPLASVVPGLDPGIQAIVDKAIAKDPRERFQDANEFQAALERQLWAIGPADTPAPTALSTPPPARDSGAHPAHGSKADAAYRRAVALNQQGAVDAARRFAIEALAENADHREARAFLESLGASRWPAPPPPPPPAPLLEPEDTAATMLADRGELLGAFGREPGREPEPEPETILSAPAPRPAPVKPPPARAGIAVLWARHRKTAQIAGIAAAVVLVAGLAALLAVTLWPHGPLLTVTRPKGGKVWTTGIACGTEDSDCTANVADGETIQLRAEPDKGYVFAGFGGDCTSSGRVHMTRAANCTATFNPVVGGGDTTPDNATWELTIDRPANGMVVGPGGIRCGSVDSACAIRYPEGTEVTLSAFAELNYSFRGFTGDCDAKGATVMKGARRCGATFVAEQRPAKTTGPPVSTTTKVADRGSRGSSSRGGGGSGSSGSGLGTGIDSLPLSTGGGASTIDPLTPDPNKRVAPPLSPDELAKKDILKLLKEYRDAYERLDVPGVQRAYPAAPAASLRTAFSSYRSLKYTLEGDPEFVDVDAGRGLARVKAKFTLAPEVKVGNQAPYKREETFGLELRNGVWLIKDWSSKVIK